MTRMWLIFLSLIYTVVNGYRYDPAYVEWNLNTNPSATLPLEYSGEWTGHQYTPSPDNWRFPFYTLFLDRFVNGDPTNDNINGTLFEHDLRSNQIRHGGDLQGLVDTLDYLQGMGIKGLYIAGSPFINAPWGYDQYSPLDLTILDQHFGTLQKWREAIDAIHERGMYVLIDNTFATLGDLIGFQGYLNTSTPFTLQEHEVQWKSDRQYWDFQVGNTYNQTCAYPRFWLETGYPLGKDITDQMIGCYDSEFDQYGDTEAFGVFPDWRRQLSKFASVQDRLREWHDPVRAKLEHFYCLLIGQLDVDGYRYDKATQSTVDAMGYMNDAMRTCARRYGKKNFFTPGEITGGNVFGSIYLGLGRQPDQLPDNLTQAVTLSHSQSEYYIREANYSALDAAAFHYTTYRTLTRFLGMDGNLEAGYDAPKNWVDQWNAFLFTNDFVNPNTGLFDPRHMYGVTNQDVFRWPAIVQGVERQLLGHFITILTMPGIPLLLWGEEQAFNILDNTAPNYIFGRQPISSSMAWMEHGCYMMNSTQYYHMPLDSARTACYDERQSYDRRDPAHPVRNIIKRMYQLREEYPVLNDGMYLQQLSNQTYYYTLPGSAGTPTEFGIWSVLRAQFYPIQNLSAAGGKGDLPVWLLYSNINLTTTFEFDCSNNDSGRDLKALISPFNSGMTVKNLLHPYDEHTLIDSAVQLGFNGTDKFNGCLNKLQMPAYGFAAYVPIEQWVAPKPMVTDFTPGHDARILVDTAEGEANTIPVELHFSTYMDCHSVTESITFDSTTSSGLLPTIDNSSVVCGSFNSSNSTQYVGNIPGAWFWRANLTGVDHGIHALVLKNPHSAPIHLPSITPVQGNDSCVVLGNSTLPGNVTLPLGGNFTRTLVRRNTTGGISFPLLANFTTPCGNTTNHTSREPLFNWTNTTDKFLFRVGRSDNPMVFPLVANYSSTLLQKSSDGGLVVHHSAAGADQWRYSTNWGTTFSDWMPYTGESNEVAMLPWSGTSLQKWAGQHIRIEYYSRLTGSSDTVQEGDVDFATTRRFPHLFLNGPFNEYGFDAGIDNRMTLVKNNTWQRHLMDEWTPAGMVTQINVWGLDPNGQPDQSYVYGDVDGDSVLDRLPPSSLAPAVINITSPPPRPYLGWELIINDGNFRFEIVPSGNMWPQIILYILLCVCPVVTGVFGVWMFVLSFYRVKNNKVGIVHKISLLGLIFGKFFQKVEDNEDVEEVVEKPGLLARLRDRQNKFRQSTGNLVSADQRKKILIATMEYDIEDWKIKVKIGGLGVMAQLMGKNLAHQDLIWVVPCVGGIDYPVDEVADPMIVVIMGKEYDVQVQYHRLRNITYVLLDAPIFRQQTQAEPYPPRMDDMPSAIYYSAWNQCIAQAINRFPIHLYHINDYHGSAAPLYLLPRTIPACLSLHNAEFQGLWPMRSKEESDEVCWVFNLPEDIVQRYVQFGEVFNLLHAGASYLREHQAGFGAVGVSKKYGKRAYARYPIFWGLKRVGQLPNPDPSDTGEWDKKLPKESDIQIDPEFEAGRAELRRQAQEWAGLEQNPNAELFVFVGRWSMQKGIDLIADVFPSLIEANPNIQLVTVGPVIDLFGKFAAAKLDRMMKVYPGRVCSKPVFTQIPPCVFSGAEFALIPSRDEPFGLVAVEFGRKGALGVGARVGGLGQMPGWWYTVESTTTGHLLQQFRIAIQEALNSKTEVRALMRARSAKQRFPVAQWVEDLEILQSTAVRIHDKMEGQSRHAVTAELMGGYPGFDPYSANATPWGSLTPAGFTPAGARTPSGQSTPRFKKHRSLVGLSERLDRLKEQSENGKLRRLNTARYSRQRGVSLGTRKGPGHIAPKDVYDEIPQLRHLPTVPRLSPMGNIEEQSAQSESIREDRDYDSDDSEGGHGGAFDAANSALDWMITRLNQQFEERNFDGASRTSTERESQQGTIVEGGFGTISIPDMSRPTTSEQNLDRPTPYMARDRPSPYLSVTSLSDKPSMPTTPTEAHAKSATRITFGEVTRSRPVSTLSVDTVVGDKTDYKLQHVEPFFTDSTGQYLREFESKLENLNGSNSYRTCIEQYLIKSERKWFDSFRDAKLGRNYPSKVLEKDFGDNPSEEPPREVSQALLTIAEVEPDQETPRRPSFVDEFLLGRSYVPPTGLRKWMQVRIGDWPIYSLFLAFGQIVAANSYQVTLLTGEIGQTANKLYAISSIYLVTTLCWWMLHRRYPSILCLSLPFFLYGLAFLFVGFAHYDLNYVGQGWIQNVGTGFYAAASSSGWVFFALNFGDDGGTETSTIMFRACVIQGTQQLYVVGLWFWGSYLSRRNASGLLVSNPISQSWRVTAICIPIALLFWTIGFIVWFGLPNYYRQHPGQVRSFYRSILRRKIVLWFFYAVAVQNFFLSAPYGRNWSFLWKSTVAQPWQIILLIIFFFVIVWASFLWLFGWLSKFHTWILPLFAIGLGAPRWAQIWWATSNVGLYLPWAGTPLTSALASRALWLWLGTLDSIQGVGLGMILLATLTRAHVAFTLVMAQVIGSVFTILARAFAPNNVGPGPISPDISASVLNIFNFWFWIGLGFNLSICIGFYMFYRKEQLSKP